MHREGRQRDFSKRILSWTRNFFNRRVSYNVPTKDRLRPLNPPRLAHRPRRLALDEGLQSGKCLIPLLGYAIKVFPDLIDRLRIELKNALATFTSAVHELCPFQDAKMLGDGLAGKVRALRQVRDRTRPATAKLHNRHEPRLVAERGKDRRISPSSRGQLATVFARHSFQYSYATSRLHITALGKDSQPFSCICMEFTLQLARFPVSWLLFSGVCLGALVSARRVRKNENFTTRAGPQTSAPRS